MVVCCWVAVFLVTDVAVPSVGRGGGGWVHLTEPRVFNPHVLSGIVIVVVVSSVILWDVHRVGEEASRDDHVHNGVIKISTCRFCGCPIFLCWWWVLADMLFLLFLSPLPIGIVDWHLKCSGGLSKGSNLFLFFFCCVVLVSVELLHIMFPNLQVKPQSTWFIPYKCSSVTNKASQTK